MLDEFTESIPRFYGSVTVGERGQIAIPAEARREHDITPGNKLLAFGGPERRIMMFVKAEFVTEFITGMTRVFSHVENILKTDITEESE